MGIESVECPNCGASLDIPDGGITECRFCGSVIRVDDTGKSDIPDEAMDEIRGLLSSGRKIDAIKVHRKYSTCSLKESKEAVESIARGMGISTGSGCGTVLMAALSLCSVLLLLTFFV